MTGRRRHPRYLLNEPLDARLRVREEVAIERWDEDEILVLSTAPSRAADSLILELPGPDPRHLRVRVDESRPVVAPDGSLRHRLRLVVEPGQHGGNGNGRAS
jgi:hypothetical protein